MSSEESPPPSPGPPPGEGQQGAQKDDQFTLKWEDIHYFLDKQKDIIRTLIPIAPSASERSLIKKEVEEASIELLRAYIVSSSRHEIVTAGFEVDGLEDKILEAQNDQEAFKLVDDFRKRAISAEDEFQETLTDEIVKSHPHYVQFQKELDELYEELEDDRQNESTPSTSATTTTKEKEFIPTTDPVTKTPLTDPIKNSLCNHFYGKASIMEIIAKNRKARCPYGGCPNKSYLRKEHLVVDEEMALKIAKKIEDEAEKEDGDESINKLDETTDADQ